MAELARRRRPWRKRRRTTSCVRLGRHRQASRSLLRYRAAPPIPKARGAEFHQERSIAGITRPPLTRQLQILRLPPKELSRSEQIEVSKLQKKAQKAQDKGDDLLAEQYRKDISRIQGVPFRPQVPRAQAAQGGDGETPAGMTSQTSQSSHASSRAGSSSAQSYASGASERSESQSQLSYSIQSGSASLASVPELAEAQGGSSGGGQATDGAVQPGQAAGKMKKGLFSKLKR